MSDGGAVAKAGRSFSLDVFRGLTMAGMILVNSPGSDTRYSVLEHAAWNGFTPTDLVFPTFAFIMGVSIVMSMSKRSSTGQGKGKLLWHIFYRAAIIFFLGFLWNYNPLKSFSYEMHIIRVMGVLQRLALCYLFTSIIVMYTGKRGQLAAFVACVGGYWLMMKCVPVPGHGAGDLSRFGNLAGYIDRHVFHAHLHKPGWDPEGLLHTLPAIGTCLLGALTGHWIRGEKSLPEKAAGLFTAGNICIVAGLILDRYFPINKNLWSPSYVFLCGGLSMSIHAACIWFVDIRGRNKATMPFVYMGMNPLFAYLMSSLVLAIFNLIPVAKAAGGTVTLKPYVFDHFYASWLSIKTASMCFALSYVVFWILVTGLMYKKKWFVKI